MKNTPKTSEQAEFLCRIRVTTEEFTRCGIEWGEIEAICSAYVSLMPELQIAANTILERLRQVPQIHSVKVRIKSPDSLVAKIVRKRLEKPDRPISRTNFSTEITDLIGIRALHLFKDGWAPIDECVQSTWDLGEMPKAYYRDGDPEEILAEFKNRKCETERHVFGYRSVHYLLRTQPAKTVYLAELQVRTLFEEAWSEIDHRMRYPNHSTDAELAQFLQIFNRLAGSADEMGSFIKNLSRSLRENEDRLQQANEKLARSDAELKKTISQLNLTAKEKAKLEKQFEEVRQSSASLLYSSGWNGLVSGEDSRALDSIIRPVGYLSPANLLRFAGPPKCTSCGGEMNVTVAGLGHLGVCASCLSRGAPPNP